MSSDRTDRLETSIKHTMFIYLFVRFCVFKTSSDTNLSTAPLSAIITATPVTITCVRYFHFRNRLRPQRPLLEDDYMTGHSGGQKRGPEGTFV